MLNLVKSTLIENLFAITNIQTLSKLNIIFECLINSKHIADMDIKFKFHL